MVFLDHYKEVLLKLIIVGYSTCVVSQIYPAIYSGSCLFLGLGDPGSWLQWHEVQHHGEAGGPLALLRHCQYGAPDGGGQHPSHLHQVQHHGEAGGHAQLSPGPNASCFNQNNILDLLCPCHPSQLLPVPGLINQPSVQQGCNGNKQSIVGATGHWTDRGCPRDERQQYADCHSDTAKIQLVEVLTPPTLQSPLLVHWFSRVHGGTLLVNQAASYHDFGDVKGLVGVARLSFQGHVPSWFCW